MLSKKMQTSSNRLKPEIVKDRKYLSWLHESGQSCMICNVEIGLEAHHVKRDSTDKRSDDSCLILCWEHHHGTELSPHGTPKLFREMYPIEWQKNEANKLYNQYKKEI